MQPTFGTNRLLDTKARLGLIKAGVVQFDVRQWQPWSASRCAVGVAIPVLGSVVIGHPAYGTLAGLGALYTALGSFRGVYRARLRSMFLIAFATTLMTLIGVMVGQSILATAIVIPIIAFGFALYSNSSLLANSLSTMAICVLVVLSGLNLPASSALGNAGLVLAGGLIQLLLLTVAWPVNPRYPERKAVSDAFASLGEFLERTPKGENELIPGTQVFEDARSILDDAQSLRWRAEHNLMAELMRSAEILRAATVGFGHAVQAEIGPEREIADKLCLSLAADLKFAAASILAGHFGELERVGSELPEPFFAPRSLSHRYTIMRDGLSSLCCQEPEGAEAPTVDDSKGFDLVHTFSYLTQLPHVSCLRAVALTHALRYTVTLEIAVLLSRFLPGSHLYWLPLSVAIVFRPDFSATITRGAARMLGTLVGVLASTAFLTVAHPPDAVYSILVLVATWFCFALIQANYALYSIAITFFVIFSIGSAGLGPHNIGLTRLEATVAGAALSLIAYIIWPAFQGRELSHTIADALQAQVEFGEKVQASVDLNDADLEEARTLARQLRIRAENLYLSAALEPWGMSSQALGEAQSAIMVLDANAAELLALRADQGRDSAKVREVLDISEALRDRLATSG